MQMELDFRQRAVVEPSVVADCRGRDIGTTNVLTVLRPMVFGEFIDRRGLRDVMLAFLACNKEQNEWINQGTYILK